MIFSPNRSRLKGEITSTVHLRTLPPKSDRVKTCFQPTAGIAQKRTTSSHKNLELSLAKAKITSNEKQTLL